MRGLCEAQFAVVAPVLPSAPDSENMGGEVGPTIPTRGSVHVI